MGQTDGGIEQSTNRDCAIKGKACEQHERMRKKNTKIYFLHFSVVLVTLCFM